jgi:hypothetical protein
MGSDRQQVLAIPGDDQLGASGDGHSGVFFCSVTLDAFVMRYPQSATMNLQAADFKAAFQGAVTGGAFGYVGGTWAGDTFGNYAGHALVGCASGAMNGGGGEGCARGAVSQVISKWVTLRTETWGPAGQFAAATIAGGTTSVITGGKFATGAQTAAFGYLFNCLAHKCNGADYSEKDSNFHEYGPFASSVCDTAAAGCLDAARQQLMCNSAPGQSACAVVGREISQGLSGGNPITQYAASPDMVINGTSPGHVFHDGYVVRWLSVNDAGIAQIWTYGRGVNTNFLTTVGNQYGGVAIFKWIGLRNSAEANKQVKKDGNGP